MHLRWACSLATLLLAAGACGGDRRLSVDGRPSGGTGGSHTGEPGASDAAAAERPTDDGSAGGAVDVRDAAAATDGPAEDAANAPVPGLCPADGWCWENPRPQGNTLRALAGSGPDDLWAVGDAGTILRWNGERWTAVPGGGETYFTSIWSAGPSEAWAGGHGGFRPGPGLFRWDGQAWRAVVTPFSDLSVLAIAGSGADLWLSGPGGLLYERRGGMWQAFSLGASIGGGAILGLWADGPDRLWAVGADGVALAGRVPTLTPVGRVTSGDLRAVDGRSDGDVFAVGAAGGIGRGDRRGGWSTVAGPTSAGLHAIDAQGSTAWAVGDAGTILRWDGADWSSVVSPTGRTLRAVRGDGTEAWAAGDGGALLRWQGGRWSSVHDVVAEDLTAMWASSDDDVWAVGRRGAIARRTGGRWSRLAGVTADLTSIWGSGPDDVWVGGLAGLWRWDGRRLSPVEPALTGTRGLGGTGANDVWAVGAAIHRWDGQRWTKVADSRASSVAAVTRDDVWMGQDTEGSVARWHAGIWTSYTVPACGRVWAAAEGDVWCVSGDGSSARSSRWTGNAWTTVPCGQGGLYAITGRGASDVWMAGTHGEIVHWDGQGCSRRGMQVSGPGSERGFTDLTFRALWATAGGSVWLAGAGGAILRRP